MVAFMLVLVALMAIVTIAVYRLVIRNLWREISMRSVDPDSLDPAQVAYLVEGPELVWETCVGMLRSADLVQLNATGSEYEVRATGADRPDLPALCQAIQRAGQPLVSGNALAVQPTLTELRQELEEAGLLRTTEVQRSIGRGSVTVLGFAPLFFLTSVLWLGEFPELSDQSSWQFWVFRPVHVGAGAALALGAVLLLWVPMGQATWRGQRIVERLAKNLLIEPPRDGAALPSSDARQVGMRTALRRPSYLWEYDPEFAERVGIRKRWSFGDGGASMDSDDGDGDGDD